ncbi:amidohydrolase family protein, partial [Chloroflexota bacterium]
GSAELIREAKDRGINVTAEVTPHHLTLTEEMVEKAGTLAKVNPPLRTAADVAALMRALKEGVIDIIATDHAPHAAQDKAGEFEAAACGISGLETAFGSLMALVHGGQLTLAELVLRLTASPARLLGRSDLGTLAVGAAADLVLFDPEKEWQVIPERFYSKGHNTPLAGAGLRGKIMETVRGGRLVHSDPALKITGGEVTP